MHKQAERRFYAIPSFTKNEEHLVKIGLAMVVSARKAKKLRFKKKVKFEDKQYEWSKMGKYQLLEICSHKLCKDLDVVLKEDQRKQKLWYQSIGYEPILKMLRENENGNGYNEDLEDGEEPQCVFGRLMFECKWKGWPVPTWETWNCLQNTSMFEEYCDEKEWNVENELEATIKEHSGRELQQILYNMSIFGDKRTRRHIKGLFDQKYRLW